MIDLGAGAPQPHIDLGLVTHGPGHAWAVAVSVTDRLPILDQSAISQLLRHWAGVSHNNNGGAA